jgi:phosphoserine aminotransferase
LRALLSVPDAFAVLFMQGGGLAENAIVPLNLARSGKVDVMVSGSWSAKSADEAARYADVHRVADTRAEGCLDLPPAASWSLRQEADYLHLCSNETIDGVEFHELPDLRPLGCDAPLVVDCSSNQLSRPMDWSRIGLAFGGAQKNIGPAGRHAWSMCAANCSAARCRPVRAPSTTSAWRDERLDVQHPADLRHLHRRPGVPLGAQGFEYAGLRGLAAIERQNIDKAAALYAFLDRSALFFNAVAPAVRSRMNIPFFLREPQLTDTSGKPPRPPVCCS